MIVYTLGYTGITVATLDTWSRQHTARICDVRYSPRSRNPQYARERLQRRFGARYCHIPALGNRNYKGGPIQLVDLEAGVAALTTATATWPAAIVLCACPSVTTCHRRLIAQRLAQDGWSVTHLQRYRASQLLFEQEAALLLDADACPYCGRPGNGEPCAPHCAPREE